MKRLSQQIVLTNDPFSDPIYFVCAALDPEFKFYWLGQMNYKPTVESQMKQTLIQMIMDECEQNVNTSFDDIQHMQSQLLLTSVGKSHTTQLIGTSIIKKRKLFQYGDDDRD